MGISLHLTTLTMDIIQVYSYIPGLQVFRIFNLLYSYIYRNSQRINCLHPDT